MTLDALIESLTALRQNHGNLEVLIEGGGVGAGGAYERGGSYERVGAARLGRMYATLMPGFQEAKSTDVASDLRLFVLIDCKKLRTLTAYPRPGGEQSPTE